MRAVWLRVDEQVLAERRRQGLDGMDELWDGVLHMVPPASYAHGNLMTRLWRALDRIARRRGLVANGDGIGVFDTDNNYRVPDATIARPEHITPRGLRGAELVVEILSPDDEARDKLPFYAKVGVREVWLVEPNTYAIEVLENPGGAWVQVQASGTREQSPLLGIEIDALIGTALRLRDGDESIEV